MRIEEIREIVKENLNQELLFKVNGARNQTEEFKGKIIEMYNCIFLIEDSTNKIRRSFTYSDILIKNLIIYFKK